METFVLMGLALALVSVGFAFTNQEDLKMEKEGFIKSPSSSFSSVFGPGIHYRETSEEPVFYTSFVPIIFQFERPTWDKMDLDWSEAENCSSAGSKKSGFACPIVYSLKQITGSLSKTLSLQTQLDNSYTLANNIVEDFSCEKVLPHFKSLSSVNISDYLEALKVCPLGRAAMLQEIKPFVSPEQDLLFSSILETLNSTSVFHIHDASVSNAIKVNAYTALQSIFLTRRLLDNERWNSVVRSCSIEHKLSPDLINEADLNANLASLQSEAMVGENYEFSVPIEMVRRLYSLEVTDCAYANEYQTLLVRLLVPVRPRDFRSLEYRQLHNVPSIYSTVSGYKLCQVQGIPKEIAYSGSNNNDKLYKVSCEDAIKSKLCHVSLNEKRDDDDNPTNDRSFECATAILRNSNDKVILKHCKSYFTCSPFDVVDAPYIKKISPSTLFYSRANVRFRLIHIIVKCNGEDVDTFPVSNSTISEFLLTVPCNCTIWQNNTRIFSSAPCSSIDENPPQLSKRAIQQLDLPEEILLPACLEDSINMYVALKQRLNQLESSAKEYAKGDRRFYSLLSLLIISISCFCAALSFFLWKRQIQRKCQKSSYAMLDRTHLIGREDD